MSEGRCPFITTNEGLIVHDEQTSLKIGSRGPLLLEDHILREKITSFDHERIPERVVHARGTGCRGYFTSYDNWEKITSCNFLNSKDKVTDVFVRFSQTIGEKGSSDYVRDIRGFAVKFYTDEGNYDFVGNNIPVFFISDPIKFPDLVHAFKPEPHYHMPQATLAHSNAWDYISLTPETSHMLMWAMSDIAVPSSYRKMNGSSVNTFKFVNKDGKVNLIKLHFISLLGLEGLEWEKVQELSGKDPDGLRRDLWEAIDRGNYPEWEFCVQLMDPEIENNLPFDPLDATKIWPESLFPLIKLGRLTLNKNVDNFFAETEQVAFCPSHVVRGIDLSDDPLLQGRLFSYLDTQLSRIGPNFHQIPVNRPKIFVNNYQQDGFMRMDNIKGQVNYYPNTRGGGCPVLAKDSKYNKGWITFSKKISGRKIQMINPKFNDHFSQATARWNNVNDNERNHIVNAFAFELNGVSEQYIVNNVINNILYKISPDLANRVENKIKPRFSESGHKLDVDETGRVNEITYLQM